MKAGAAIWHVRLRIELMQVNSFLLGLSMLWHDSAHRTRLNATEHSEMSRRRE